MLTHGLLYCRNPFHLTIRFRNLYPVQNIKTISDDKTERCLDTFF